MLATEREKYIGEYGVEPVSHVLDEVVLPVCESCGNVLTIRDPNRFTDGEPLLCGKCERLGGGE